MSRSNRTPEQVAADQALVDAVTGVLNAYGALGPTDHLDRFVSVLSIVAADEPDSTAYHLMFSDGGMPAHVALGLLHIGTQIAEVGGGGFA